MLAMALLIVPTALAPLAGSMWTAVLIVSRGRGGAPGVVCQRVYAGERHVPARGGGLGSGDRRIRRRIGGWAFQRATGRILQANGNNYTPIFIVCGLAYVSAGPSFTFSLRGSSREHRMNRQEVLTMRQIRPRRAFLTATAASVAGAGLTPSLSLSALWRRGQG